MLPNPFMSPQGWFLYSLSLLVAYNEQVVRNQWNFEYLIQSWFGNYKSRH